VIAHKKWNAGPCRQMISKWGAGIVSADTARERKILSNYLLRKITPLYSRSSALGSGRCRRILLLLDKNSNFIILVFARQKAAKVLLFVTL
jgi:hypothetical protein